MKYYLIYCDPKLKQEQASIEPEDITAVPDKHFNIYAFLFGILWLLYKRFWLGAGIFFTAIIFVVAVFNKSSLTIAGIPAITIAELLVNILLAIYTQEIEILQLLYKKHVFCGPVYAQDATSAKLQWLKNHNAQS